MKGSRREFLEFLVLCFFSKSVIGCSFNQDSFQKPEEFLDIVKEKMPGFTLESVRAFKPDKDKVENIIKKIEKNKNDSTLDGYVKSINKCISEDFKSENTAELEGWIISETEAILFAHLCC